MSAHLLPSWTTYLDENITQAVTSYLRIHTGRAAAAAEMERLKGYYALAPAIMEIFELHYLGSKEHASFEAFFPVLLKELGKQYPQ